MSDDAAEESRRKWREKYSAYSSDFNLMAGPLRRDALEIVKESGAWARLAVQYALIVNAGALAALPYLLNHTGTYRIDVSDASGAACWFAGALFAAALCCLIAYINAQLMASAYWSDWDAEVHNTGDRHFGNEKARQAVPVAVARAERIRKHTGWTSLLGMVLGVASWSGFIWGALQLILFRVTPG
jgi:hypothetical protein